ncbi:MAG: CocE/NonD family hydrolase [Tetrasphaera sp.]
MLGETSSGQSRRVDRPGDRLRARTVDAVLRLPHVSAAYTLYTDVTTPLEEGVTLLGDLYRPDTDRQEGGDPRPTVLIRVPYGRRGVVGAMYGDVLARRGHQVFIQSTRGTFGSGGQFRPFTTEHEDGMATLAWLRAQPWCDGRVAMLGASYFGHTQWAIAPYAEPPLACVSPAVTAARIAFALYDNGVPQLLNALLWTSQIAGQETRAPLRAILPDPTRMLRVRRAAKKLPLQAVDVAVTGGPVPFWRDFVAFADPDDTSFWDVSDHSHADLTAMPPTSIVTGWWDLFLREQLHDHERLVAAGVPTRLVIGPWMHVEPGAARESITRDLAWLDHHLDGGPAPTGAPVRILLQGPDTWLDLPSWPPPQSRSLQLHLGPGGTLGQEPPSGRSPTSRFTYDPGDPTPSVGGPMLNPPGKQADNGDVEERADVLVFTGDPLPADLDVVGQVDARIYVRTSLPHADVFIRVCDVDEKGVSRNVVDGIRRLHPATMTAADVRLGEEGIVELNLELWPTAYRFAAGHRIRVQVAGGAFPRYARNLGTGEPLGTGLTMRRCDFQIFHDDAHPSRIELSVPAAPGGSATGRSQA